MALNEQDQAELVNGGDTRLHYHNSDRVPTHDTLEGLAAVENIRSVDASYVSNYQDDFILVDSTAGAVTIDIPKPLTNRVTVLRVAGANNVTVQSVGYTVNGAASAIISSNYTPLRLKALKDIGYFNC